MNSADFNELSEEEKQHFYQCQRCGEWVDKRQLDEVIFHEDHKQRPDIQYAGSERLDDPMEAAIQKALQSKPVAENPRMTLTVAYRFGKTYHISFLRKKLEKLRAHDPEPMGSYEEWLISAAQKRTNNEPGQDKLKDVSNEQLIVTLLLLENIDRPELFETAALLISRVPVDEQTLTRLAEQERVDFLLPQIRR